MIERSKILVFAAFVLGWFCALTAHRSLSAESKSNNGDKEAGVTRGNLAHADDYNFGFYPHGLRGRSKDNDILYAVQTNEYGLLFNASQARVDRLGPVRDPWKAEQAVSQKNDILLSLPEVKLTFALHLGEDIYEAKTAADAWKDVKVYRLGKYFQNFEVHNVAFYRLNGEALAGITARLEFFCWSDRLAAALHVACSADLAEISLSAECSIPDEFSRTAHLGSSLEWSAMNPGETSDLAVAFSGPGGAGVAMLNPSGATQKLTLKRSGGAFIRSKPEPLTVGSATSLSLVIVPARDDILRTGLCEAREVMTPMTDISASVNTPYNRVQTVEYDPVVGWYKILLDDGDEGRSRNIWSTEQLSLQIKNRDQRTRRMRLNVALEGTFPCHGSSAVLCDRNHVPLGLPVQISKRWHSNPHRLDNLSIMDLDPGQNLNLAFAIPYAKWGKTFATAHVQVDVGGWTSDGKFQQWDMLTIGSAGENITYDANRSFDVAMLCDVRPTLMWSMGKEPRRKWGFTPNVGGATFLVLHNPEKQNPSRLKTYYKRYSPVLSEIVYAGQTQDEKIQYTIRAQSWQVDDYVRSLYTIRYDVTAPVADIERLAFFQMGTDRYDASVCGQMARGTLEGLEETWKPDHGGNRYSRRGVPFPGEHPWLSLYETTRPQSIRSNNQGAIAGRGLIIRKWDARLGGRNCSIPYYSVYGHKGWGGDTALIELSPPPGLANLKNGDYVDMQLELILVPQSASDYYGPNDNLRKTLEANPNGWHLTYRETKGNNLDVEAFVGTVEQTFPVRIRAHEGRNVEFSIRGGIGYVPVTISGVADRSPFILQQQSESGYKTIDLSDRGNDGWQADYDVERSEWEITFIIPEDSSAAPSRTRSFHWSQPTVALSAR